jgi:hypothetical protein
MSDLTPEQAARIRQLDKERTPVEWRVVCGVGDYEILGPPAGNETLHIARFDNQYGAGKYESYRTSSKNANFAAEAANAIIPALDEIAALLATIARQVARIGELEKALQFYADGDHYETTPDDERAEENNIYLQDFGEVARAALTTPPVAAADAAGEETT